METVNLDKAKEIIDGGLDKAQEVLQSNEELNELLTKVQAKIDEVPVLKETLADAKDLFSLLKSYVNKEYADISPRVVGSVVSALLYLITKKDVIPDRIPILGILDDLAVCGVALKVIEPELDTYRAWRKEHPEETK